MPRDVFQAEVEAWAERIGVHPKVVQVRPMKRKWGSCSTAGRVTFDTDLLRQHAEFRKRAIVEELLHLPALGAGLLACGERQAADGRATRSGAAWRFAGLAVGANASSAGALLRA